MTRPLQLDLETMRAMGYAVADLVAEHLATLRSQPVIASQPRPMLTTALARPAPREGRGFDELLGELQREVFPYHAREPHPGFLAYVPSCPTFPAVMGDWIASGFNFFAGVWPVAGGPNELEMVVLDWFRSWTGMPEGSTGLLVSGGSAANLTAMVAARHRATENGRELGRLIVYTSDQAHSSVTRAAWIAAIPRANVRSIPTDQDFALDTGSLEDAIRTDRAAGLTPFLVVANAGTTNTGSVDPLARIAGICRESGVWLHVDAAYAGFAVLTERGQAALSGMGLADSLTLDPHKQLYVPFECGCLMVRDATALTDVFRIYPEYLQDVEPGEEEVNFADRGEQLTRYARALKIWMSVNYYGTEAIAAAIDDAMDLALLVESSVVASETLELLSPARFGIVCFRANPRDSAIDLDALNQRVNARVVQEGRFLISSTRIRGSFSLRVCILGYRTTADDIRELMSAIEDAARVETLAAS